MDLDSLVELDFQTENGVAWVRLNRPDTHNALSVRMRRELQLTWQALRRDDDVRCVVLTGAGSDAFCSGIDRSELAMDGSKNFNPFDYDDLGAEIGPKANGLWKPVIAAVNGLACGGAFYLLGEVEFIVAAEHATFFDPHVSYGMAAVYEPMMLSGRMAFGDLMRLSLVGLEERMSATSARQSGLVSEVVPTVDLDESVRRTAESIASLPSLPVQATVRSMWAARRLGIAGAVDMGNFLLASGNDRELLKAGQLQFRTKSRPEGRH